MVFRNFTPLMISDRLSTLTRCWLSPVIRVMPTGRCRFGSSVGFFGWGNDSSSYWKMSSVLTQSVPADSSWHLLAGTYDEGKAVRRTGSKSSSKLRLEPKFHSQTFGLGWFRCQRLLLAIGSCGSFCLLSIPRNWPPCRSILVSNGKAAICLTSSSRSNRNGLSPGFSHSSFADSAIGGDLRFFDEQNRELSHEIDEWNSSGKRSPRGFKSGHSVSIRRSLLVSNTAEVTPPGYRTDGSLWSGYEGVWHLDSVLDSSGNARNATSNGGVALIRPDSSVMVCLWMAMTMT